MTFGSIANVEDSQIGESRDAFDGMEACARRDLRLMAVAASRKSCTQVPDTSMCVRESVVASLKSAGARIEQEMRLSLCTWGGKVTFVDDCGKLA